jgi:hypothetical protein
MVVRASVLAYFMLVRFSLAIDRLRSASSVSGFASVLFLVTDRPARPWHIQLSRQQRCESSSAAVPVVVFRYVVASVTASMVSGNPFDWFDSLLAALLLATDTCISWSSQLRQPDSTGSGGGLWAHMRDTQQQ